MWHRGPLPVRQRQVQFDWTLLHRGMSWTWHSEVHAETHRWRCVTGLLWQLLSSASSSLSSLFHVLHSTLCLFYFNTKYFKTVFSALYFSPHNYFRIIIITIIIILFPALFCSGLPSWLRFFDLVHAELKRISLAKCTRCILKQKLEQRRAEIIKK